MHLVQDQNDHPRGQYSELGFQKQLAQSKWYPYTIYRQLKAYSIIKLLSLIMALSNLIAHHGALV
jgi:hypothetical protein